MTKILSFIGLFKSQLLADELRTTFPAWEPVTSEGTSRLFSDPAEPSTWVELHVPDNANESEIQIVINNHNPNALSLGEQIEIYQNDVRDLLANSSLAGKTPDEVYIIMQGSIDSWGSLADAKTDFREWMPLLFAYIVHLGNK